MSALLQNPYAPAMASTVRVAVVDDSVVVRGLLSKWLSETPAIEVIGTYRSGKEIIDALPAANPKIILLDLDMPEMDGLTALPLILARSPQSRVIVVSSLSVHGAELTMRSLMKGATDYLPKPSNHREVSTSNDFRQALIAKVLAVGGVRQAMRAAAARPPIAAPAARPAASANPLFARNSVRAAPPAAPSLRGAPVTPATHLSPALRPTPFARPPLAPHAPGGMRPIERVRPKIIVIGASTGGPQALVTLLGNMKRAISRVPVVIAQHMPPIFGPIFASHLKQHVGLPAVEVEDGLELRAGTIYLAPGGCHTVIRKRADGTAFLSMLPSEARGPWRPSIDLLFSSAAESLGNDTLAIALTGMGKDGTEGAGDLARRGANIIVQDEASSVVWGIPGSIAEAGLSAAQLAPDKLGELAQSLVEGSFS